MIVDTDSASCSTSSASPREDKELYSKDDVDAEPVKTIFYPYLQNERYGVIWPVGDALNAFEWRNNKQASDPQGHAQQAVV
jgi:hypothetical protein